MTCLVLPVWLFLLAVQVRWARRRFGDEDRR
jgi:hypothetical protein